MARRLFDIFFLGQFFLVALMAPTFAAGSITGEKERKTYEMLLASPLRPGTILVGKLLSSLSYLVILIVSSLPLMILCYLLGGLLLSEITRELPGPDPGRGDVRAAEHRLLELLPPDQLGPGGQLPGDPPAGGRLRGADADRRTSRRATSSRSPCCRPGAWRSGPCVGILINRRLLHPPDVGSEGKDVVDEEEEMKYAIGVVIDRDLFPDKLFAPAKRTDLMPDGTNPVLDKELRSEIFSQGTLMLRVVIQVSMLLSIPLMAVLLFLRSDLAAYYVAYVLTFNLLVGPVFSAGSITQERERQTLEPAADDACSDPAQIVCAKLLAALRVSTVLTFLLTEQILLAYVLLPELRGRFWTLVVFLLIIADDLPGDLDDRPDVLGAGAADVGGDGPDVHDAADPLRGADRAGLVPPGRSRRSAKERLAALTITSPFSAALSVPMHTTRNEALDRASRSRSTRPC